MTRPGVSLTDVPWRFCPDPSGDGEALGFFREDYTARLWREVTVPSCFETVCPNLEFYEGICWYRRSFTVPPAWHSRRIVLHFGAANYRARVWLNGELLGENRDGFLPFEFDIHRKVRSAGTNTLTVAVDNRHHEGDVPGMHVGWRGQGGILREVCLYATDHAYLDSTHVTAAPEAGGGNMAFRVRIRNRLPETRSCRVAIAVRDAEGQTCREINSSPVPVDPGGTAVVSLQDTLADALPWSPSSPVCYQATVRLVQDDDILDETVVSFGFRRIEAMPEGLLLNGEKIFLVGFNRHDDSPRTAMAFDVDTTRADLEMMKDAGANFVRLCHYPHDPAELDLCDELGLLAFSEIPLYFWNDNEEGKRTQAARAKTAARQLKRMIARDRNHPSLIFWSVSNETPETEPDVAADNAELIRLARSLDPTRLCVHVSNHWRKAPHFEEDDVICVNYYPSHESPGGHSQTAFNPGQAGKRWRDSLDALHRTCPGKPILVTEFGYSSFAGTNGHAFGEAEHAQVIEAEFAAFDAPYVAGATIWCWADHAWPAGRFSGGLSISPHGVLTRDRQKLKPFSTARALFRARQGIGGTSAPRPRSTSVNMIRAHMRDIPDVPFPDGYGIRAMDTDDIGLWTDIQRDAETHINITADLFRRQFGSDLESIGRRCFIVTGPGGLGVGTISAWYDHDFRGEDCGRIHWVCVRPDHQGKGVGKAALAYAMQALARWHEKCYLVTSTERLAAIALYLNFGFVPDLVPPHARDVWEEFHARFDHPALAQALAES